MIVPVIAAVIATPGILKFANRLLEEAVIPVRVVQEAKRTGDMPRSFTIRAALTKKDIQNLRKNGGMDILERGMAVQDLADQAGVEL